MHSLQYTKSNNTWNIRSCKNHEGGSFWSVRHPSDTASGTGVGRVSRSRYWYYMLLHTTIGKRRSGAFKQKKVYQNRTIIKEVMSKNVHPAPVPDDPTPGAGSSGTHQAPVRHRCWMDIFADNFLNNGPILINFFLFESSWSPLCNGTLVLDPAPSSTQHYPASSTYNPACASYLLVLVFCSRLHHPAPVWHHPAPNTIQHHPAPNIIQHHPLIILLALALVTCSC